MTPLCELARLHKTDKGGNHTLAGAQCHNYTPVYHSLLGTYRERVKAVLEIGVNSGCSLRMWRDYFPNARIVGLDNKPDCLIFDTRIESFLADQSNAESLEGALNRAGIAVYDLIVDDGSHHKAHQILSANVLAHRLAKTGLYIIEDVELGNDPYEMIKQIQWGHWIVAPTQAGIGRTHQDVLLVGEHRG